MRTLIGLDQSTQGTKAVLTDETGRILHKCSLPHRQIVTPQGWVSHDGEEILQNVKAVLRQVVVEAGVSPGEVAALGISNQRETTIAWDRETGAPADHAVVWQCARGEEITREITDEGFLAQVRERTGIPLSPYFPAAKAAWLLRHSERARALARKGALCLGTMDSFLVHRLTEGAVFATDWSNASRTQLLDLHDLAWSRPICERLGIPVESLPGVRDSNGDFGATTLEGFFPRPVPIRGVLGDSHAALFGQGCIRPGQVKATYGTGSSIMMNIGKTFKASRSGLVTSLAWGMDGKVTYVLEGNINYAAAVVTWLQEIGLIRDPEETEALARAANPEDETVLVPAFTGVGAPYWSDRARAAFLNMSRTTGRAELVRAGLESIAFQVADILACMGEDAGLALEELRVDGAPTANGVLMQLQSDLTGAAVRVPGDRELSALGAALMAGLAVGAADEERWRGQEARQVYTPQMAPEKRRQKLENWRACVRSVLR